MGKVSRTTISAFIFACGVEGTTVEEIAHHFGLTPQQVSASVDALRRDKHVVLTDETRDVGLIPGSPVWKDAIHAL
jgi:transposase-like protein